jgi:tetratricopeptide (TPR) repeat protein
VKSCERSRLILAVSVSGLAFVLYLLSATPGLAPYRDSGDMAASAWTLGVAHPPGYPLYLLLGRLWAQLLALGGVAYRLHALSALAGAAAAGIAAWAVARAGEDSEGLFGGAVAGALLALSPAFWHLSLVSEMYSLNGLVGAALLALLLPLGARARDGKLRAGALLFGLGLGNHQTLVAALPGLLVSARFRFGVRRVAAVSSFFALGAVLYAYLPLRSFAEPLLDWGEPETLRNFFRLVTRADYGGVRLHPERPAGLFSASAWASGLAHSGRLAVGELGWFGAGLALWGLIAGRRRSEIRGAALAAVASGPLFVVWANLDPSRPETYAILEPHLVLPVVFAACLAGWGLADLLRRVPPRRRAAALPACAAAFALSHAATHAHGAAARLGNRWDLTASDYGRAMAATLPKDALVYDPDDQTAFTLSYFHLARNERPDVVALLYFRTRWGYEQLKRRRPELLPDWEIGSGQELASTLVDRALARKRPVFVDLPQKAPPGTTAVPAGLAYEIVRPAPSAEASKRRFDRALALLRTLRFRPAPEGSGFFARHVADYYASALNNLGVNAQNIGRAEDAARLYRLALVRKPGMPQAWNNLGNAWLRLGDLPAAEGAYRAALSADPSPRIRYNLGRALLVDRRYPEAETELRRSIAEGNVPDAKNDLGLVFLRTERPREAVEQWLALLRERPDYVTAYYNLGLGFEKLGDRPRARSAVRAYRAAVADPKEKAEATAWLKRLGAP